MKKIDYHHHILPKKAADFLPGINGRQKIWKIEDTLNFLDNNKIDTAAVSLYHPKLPLENRDLLIKICRVYNEEAAKLRSLYPGRISAFAALPFPFAPETISEIGYSIDVLGLDGVCLLPAGRGRHLSDKDCIPLLKELGSRNAKVLLHPGDAEGMPVVNPGYLDAVTEFTRLMYMDRLKHAEGISWILTHTAAVIPFLAENIGMLQYLQEKKNKIGKFIWDYLVKKKSEGEIILKSLYVDSADCAESTAHKSLVEFFGKDHVLWGSGISPRESSDTGSLRLKPDASADILSA